MLAWYKIVRSQLPSPQTLLSAATNKIKTTQIKSPLAGMPKKIPELLRFDNSCILYLL
jgi:hypothetical protein